MSQINTRELHHVANYNSTRVAPRRLQRPCRFVSSYLKKAYCWAAQFKKNHGEISSVVWKNGKRYRRAQKFRIFQVKLNGTWKTINVKLPADRVLTDEEKESTLGQMNTELISVRTAEREPTMLEDVQ